MRDVDRARRQIDVLTADREDLRFSHAGAQPNQDEGIELLALISLGRFQEGIRLLSRQINNPAIALLELADFRCVPIDPAPFCCLVQHVRKRG